MKLVTCPTAGCENQGIGIEITDWDGSTIVCGPCGTVLEDQAPWYEPDLEHPPARRAADLIASMTDTERAELAQLIAPPTIGQEKKQ